MSDYPVESISVQVPVAARLYVHVDHDSVDPRPATYADIEKFHLERRFGAYHRASDALRNHLTEQGLIPGDLTVSRINPLRHLFEQVSYPHEEDLSETLADIAVIERCLQRHLDAFIADEAAKETLDENVSLPMLDDYPRE